jgi:transcriptional regulator of arginine metabolism
MKAKRQAAILKLVREHVIPSQERLRELLARAGFEVTQATLSRDIRDLGLVKVSGDDGALRYSAPPEEVQPPPMLNALVPSLLLRVEGTGPLLVLRTPAGSASALAAALDHEGWPEVLGTIAGDDTLLIIARNPEGRRRLARRIAELTSSRE